MGQPAWDTGRRGLRWWRMSGTGYFWPTEPNRAWAGRVVLRHFFFSASVSAAVLGLSPSHAYPRRPVLQKEQVGVLLARRRPLRQSPQHCRLRLRPRPLSDIHLVLCHAQQGSALVPKCKQSSPSRLGTPKLCLQATCDCLANPLNIEQRWQ